MSSTYDWKKSVSIHSGVKEPEKKDTLQKPTSNNDYAKNTQKAHQDSLVEQSKNITYENKTLKAEQNASTPIESTEPNKLAFDSDKKIDYTKNIFNQNQKINTLSQNDDSEKKSLMARDQFTADDYKTEAEKSKPVDEKSDIMNYGKNKKFKHDTLQDSSYDTQEYDTTNNVDNNTTPDKPLTLAERREEVREIRREAHKNHTSQNNLPGAFGGRFSNNQLGEGMQNNSSNNSSDAPYGNLVDGSEYEDMLPDVREVYIKHNLPGVQLPQGTDVKQGYDNMKYGATLISRSAKIVSYKIAYSRAFNNVAVLSGANQALQEANLSIIDTKPTISTKEFQHNMNALAESMGYENVVFKKGLANSIKDDKIIMTKMKGKEKITQDFKMSELKYNFEGFSETDLKNYSKAFIDKRDAKAETILANDKRIKDLIANDSMLSRMNLANMSSSQIEKALKDAEHGKGIWKKFRQDKIEKYQPVILAIGANTKNTELLKKMQANSKKFRKQLGDSAKKQAQDADLVQGYNNIKKGKDIIAKTITSPKMLSESYYRSKKNALLKQINSGKDNRATRSAKKEFEKLFGEEGSRTLKDKRRNAARKRRADRKDFRSIRRQGKGADFKLRRYRTQTKLQKTLKVTKLEKYKDPKEILRRFLLPSNILGKLLAFVIAAFAFILLNIIQFLLLVISTIIAMFILFAPIIAIITLITLIPASFSKIANDGNKDISASISENLTIKGVSAINECFSEFYENQSFDLNTDSGKYKLAAILGNIDYISGFNPGINSAGLGICGWCNDVDGLSDEDVIDECMSIGGSDPFDFDNPDEALRSQIKYANYRLSTIQAINNASYPNLAKATEAYAKSSMFNVTNSEWNTSKAERIQRAKNMYRLVLAFYKYDSNTPNEYMIDHLYEDGSWVTTYAIGFMLSAQEGTSISAADVYSSSTNWNKDFVTYCLNNSGIAKKYNMNLSSPSLSYSAYATSQGKYLSRSTIIQKIDLLKPGYIVCYKASDSTQRYGVYIGNDGDYMLIADGYSNGNSYYLESSEGAFKKYSKRITSKSVIGKKLKITSSLFSGVYAWY